MNRYPAGSLTPVILALCSCVAVAQTSPTASSLAKRMLGVLQGEKVVGEFQTDEQSRFKVVLPPGSYVVTGKDPKNRLERHGPRPVQVLPDKMTPIEWDFETGMR